MHWRNSGFQILYFIAGKCHTLDEAYRVLCELKEDRELALDEARGNWFRALFLSKRKKEHLKALCRAAEQELVFINAVIQEIAPLRKYKDLPDEVAFQLCQQEEWKFKLLRQAENQLLTTGTINPDTFEAIRLHPNFKDQLWPVIKEMSDNIKAGKFVPEPNPVLGLISDIDKKYLDDIDKKYLIGRGKNG